MFSTRTIVDTLDPVWEEPAYILVPAEAIEVGEKLRMRIIDSDRFSSDDSIGQVEVDVYDLVEKSTNTPGETLFRRTDALQPEQTGMRTQGELDWSIRFFPLYKMSQAEVQRRLQAIQDKRGEGYPPPPWWMEKISSYMEVPGWETERQERRKETLAYFTGERARDEMEAAGKPTAELCSGVLQFHVHQCTGELTVPCLVAAADIHTQTWSSSRPTARSLARPSVGASLRHLASPLCTMPLTARLPTRPTRPAHTSRST